MMAGEHFLIITFNQNISRVKVILNVLLSEIIRDFVANVL